MSDHHDVLIIGAGVAGIGMACHLARECPGMDVALIERQSGMGGTWQLFRYPGIRSDSDMFSFGYGFRPWPGNKVLADGASIREYVSDTAREYGVDKKVRYGLRLLRADWSSRESLWTATVVDGSGKQSTIRARQLIACTGYYSYDQGYLPDFPGQERFKGQRIHPQFWPQDLDYKGKKVVVIGSGATAVTLVPAMAPDAAHVTMLQRSPTYIFNVPGTNRFAFLRYFMPLRWYHAVSRWIYIGLQRAIFKASRRWPDKARKAFTGMVAKQLAPGYDMKHFTPSYNPWDQRLCAVPDGDLFESIKSGRASVATGQIETFTETGIRLADGTELPADIIVTATGLQLQALGGAQLYRDGQLYDPGAHLTYCAVMLEGLPNFGWIFGYTNASWTLKVDIAARYLCRLYNHMRAKGFDVVVPRAPPGIESNEHVFGTLQSGYVQRNQDLLPRQGREAPWRVTHDYVSDRELLLKAPVDDPALEFSAAAAERKAA